MLKSTDLNDRIETALLFLRDFSSDDAHAIVDELFDRIYRAFSRDRRFTQITHDRFDELTAGVREEIWQALAEHIAECVPLADVERILKRELGDDE
jgi:hypothetical protein